jgi:hypothetical protein
VTRQGSDGRGKHQQFHLGALDGPALAPLALVAFHVTAIPAAPFLSFGRAVSPTPLPAEGAVIELPVMMTGVGTSLLPGSILHAIDGITFNATTGALRSLMTLQSGGASHPEFELAWVRTRHRLPRPGFRLARQKVPLTNHAALAQRSEGQVGQTPPQQVAIPLAFAGQTA